MAKKALIVGIDDYAPAGAGGPDLGGCVNDARDIANTLHVLGIVPATPATMRVLTNGNATRANILGGLNWLISKPKTGDQLVFYYSGHGSQLPDIVPERDEIDAKDETLCPHDFNSAGMIKDDDLARIFKNLPVGVNLEVILDCCHSGQGTRDLTAATSAATNGIVPEQIVVRYIEPTLDEAIFLEVDQTIPTRGLLKGRAGTRDAIATPALNHVLWAACRDNQLSQELPINGVRRGVFTYHFCRVLRRAGPGIARKALDAQVSREVRNTVGNQVPQLEGQRAALGKAVFGETRAAATTTA